MSNQNLEAEQVYAASASTQDVPEEIEDFPDIGSVIEIAEKQKTYPDIGPVIQWMKNGQDRPSWDDVSPTQISKP